LTRWTNMVLFIHGVRGSFTLKPVFWVNLRESCGSRKFPSVVLIAGIALNEDSKKILHH
jgi:predicted DNA-binding ribbon-helix-helix protein